MAIIYLYDKTATNFTYNGQPLPEAYQAHVDYIMNDEFFITFRYPLDKEKRYKEIEKDKIVTAHTPDGMQPFRIIDTVKRMDSVEVEAWPLFYADMRNKMIRPLSLKNATGHTAFSKFASQLLMETPFDITTNITAKHDYNTQDATEKENNPNQLYDALEVFKALVIRWNGEVVINGYDIRVLDRIGENKEALLYEKKNISNFVDEESIANIVTRVYGKSEWTETNDEGEQIEHSIEATVDSPLIDAYSGIVFEKQYTNNDLRTKKELEDWLKLKFSTENIDKPSRNIEVETNVVDGLEIGPGDGLVLKYILHDVDMRIRMIGYKYDGFSDRYILIYLGDARQSLVGNFQTSISKMENNISNTDKIVADVIINSLGQKMIYSKTEPTGNFKEGDTWFDSEGGMWFWDEEKADWIPHPYNKRTDIAEQLIKEAQKDLAEAKQTADEAVEQIDTAVANAGFTTLDETISSVQSISNQAQINSGTAIDNALEAMQQASQAVDNTGSLNVRVDEVEGTLSVKADKQTVDDLTGVVDSQALDIQANAQGLALKANQDTVDTLTGTVQSLGSEFDIVAGQVNSRVWNTDIETAIDGIEIGGRNYIRNDKWQGITGGSVNEVDGALVVGEITGSGIARIRNTSLNGAELPKTTLISFEAKADVSESIYIDFRGIGDGVSFTPSKEWKKFEFTINSDNRVLTQLYFILPGGLGDKLYLRNVKVEFGTLHTDWTPAPEDIDAKIDHIETEWTQTFDSFQQDVSSIDGRVTSQRQDIDSISSTVSGHGGRLSAVEQTADGLQTTVASKASQTQVTQLSDLLSSTVEDVEGNATQISQLSDNINLRVEKGDVINQINISDESILLQANKIQALGDVVVDGKLTITDEFIAQNAQIDGAKIADASIGSAKIASLDANKITTGEIRGINIYMKYGEIGDWSLDSGVLYSQLKSGLNTTIKATGEVALAAGAPTPRNTTNAKLQLWHSGRLRWLNSSGDTAGDIDLSGNQLHMNAHTLDVERILLPRSGVFNVKSNGELGIQNAGSLFLNPGTHVYVVGSVRPSSNGNYHLGGANYRWDKVWTTNGMSENSDIRLKNNIADIPLELLSGISQVEPKMYEMNGITKFGYIAQDVERELFKYATQVVGAKNATEYIKQFDVLDTNDESYKALMYSQVEVIKGALRDKKIEKNTGKIIHIEDEVTQLKNRIKQLEEQLNAS